MQQSQSSTSLEKTNTNNQISQEENYGKKLTETNRTMLPDGGTQNWQEKSTEITKRQQIEGTPFWLHIENNEWFITYGKFALTEKMNTNNLGWDKIEVEAQIYLQEEHYNIICKMILCTIEDSKTIKN